MSHLNPSLSDKSIIKLEEPRDLGYYLKGIIEDHDRFILSEAITLLESRQKVHRKLAYQILQSCPTNQKSQRIAITGSPGVGKSTFIEQLGQHFREKGEKVAVLTIDPSSSFTSGSILGDKARMMELAKSSEIFIRPSPSSLHLGGVHRYTYEAILLCEAAGYENIIIETVGVGQSEIEIQKFTDIVILLVLSGGGDSLQGIKKGIMETANLIIIHKADGERLKLADKMKKELHDAQHSLSGIPIPIVLHSSIENDIDEVIEKLDAIHSQEGKRKIVEGKKWLFKRLQEQVIDQSSDQILDIIKSKLSTSDPSDSIFKLFNELTDNLKLTLNVEDE